MLSVIILAPYEVVVDLRHLIGYMDILSLLGLTLLLGMRPAQFPRRYCSHLANIRLHVTYMIVTI